MRPKTVLSGVIALVFIFITSCPLLAQTCGAHQHFDDFVKEKYDKAVQNGEMTLEEAQKALKKIIQPLKTRSNEVTVLIVHDGVASTSLTLAGAQSILKSCATGTNACEVTFRQVNAMPLLFDFSSSDSGPQILADCLTAATAQNWFAQADLIVGITGTNMQDGGNFGTAGYAYIGNCTTNSNARVMVIEAGIYDALFAHEIGHTIGMNHDVVTNSVMRATVPVAPITMSGTNKNCYYTGAGCAPLPVELTHFEGRYHEGKNNLTWTTALEKDNQGFTIERSFDQTHWESIGYVKGMGNSNVSVSYAFRDAAPLSIAHYRLCQMDFNGAETRSKIISIQSKTKEKVVVSPNPVKDNLQIFLDFETAAEEVKVYDLLGRVIARFARPSQQIDVNTSGMSKGLYFVEINAAGKRIVQRFVKE